MTDVLTDKTAILARLSASRRALRAALDRAGADLLDQPGSWGDWRLKDLLAHITYWQTVAIDRLQKFAVGRANEITRLSGDEEMNQVNESVYRSNKDRPLAEMLELFDSTFHALCTAVKQFPAERYAENAQAGPIGVATIVEADGYGHDEEHLADVEKAIESYR
jgi:DinB superfamily